MRKRGSSGGRVATGVADQIVCSLSNFLLGVAVARASSPAEFGEFAVAYAGLLLAQGFVRAMVGDALIIEESSESLPRRMAAASSAITVGAALAISVGATGLVAGVALQSNIVIALSLASVPANVQDVGRYAHFAIGSTGRALMSDLLWFVGFLATFIALSGASFLSPVALLLAWGAWSAIAIIPIFVGNELRPTVASPRRWWSERSAAVKPLVAEFLTTRGLVNMTTIALGGILGSRELAGLRVANLAFGPLTTLHVAVQSVGTAELARRFKSHGEDIRPGILVSAGLVAVSLGLSLFWMIDPGGVGATLFGPSWSIADRILGATMSQKLLSAAAIGPIVILRACRRVGIAARARGLGAASGFVLGLVGGYAAGLQGAAVGLAVANGIVTIGLWFSIKASTRGVKE